MKKILFIPHIAIGLIFCNIFNVRCSNNIEQSALDPTQDIDLLPRSKRGLVLLVPTDSNEVTTTTVSEINENDPKDLPSNTVEPEKNKRDVPEASPPIFMRHNDMLDAHHYVTRVPDSQESNGENASKPYIRMKSVTDREEIIERLAEARKSRRQAEENPIAIVIGRKINRPRGTRGKKYTCYCKETSCRGRRCFQDQAEGEVNWKNNDDVEEYEDEDVSAEVTDIPIAVENYDSNKSYERKVTRMAVAEPTKFTIPFANNVNFDQRVIVGSRGDQKKKKYRILPVYQSIPLEMLKNPSQSSYRYNPHVKSQNADIYTGIKQMQRDHVGDIDSKVTTTDSYMDECIGMYGPDVCATLATSDLSDLSDEDPLDYSSEDDDLNDGYQSRTTESYPAKLNNKESEKINLPDYSSPKNVIGVKYDASAETQRSSYETPVTNYQTAPKTAALTARAVGPKEMSTVSQTGMYTVSSTTPPYNNNNNENSRVKALQMKPLDKIAYTKVSRKDNPEMVSFVQNPTYGTLRSYNLQNQEVEQSTKPVDKQDAKNTGDLMNAESKDDNLSDPRQFLPQNIDGSESNKKLYSESKTVDDKFASGENKSERKNKQYAVTTISNLFEGTETAIQSVDERPSTAYENNSKESNTELRSRANNTNDHENATKRNTSDAVLQSAIKKVINNFVPGKAQDLLANFGSQNMPAPKISMEYLLPEILDTPILVNLLSVPDVEDMIVDASIKFLIQTIDSPNHQLSYKSIKKSLRNVVDQIPRPHPTVAPKIGNENQWVTERVTLLENSDTVTTARPPKKVFDIIESIINRSGLGEQAVAQPVVQNCIVKTVKYLLDKESGVIDEFTVRRAFNMLVKPRPSVTRRTPSQSYHQERSTPVAQPNENSKTYQKNKILDDKESFNRQNIPTHNTNAANVEKSTVSTRPKPQIPKSNDGSIEHTPIKYYSPQDRILDYIKTHQSTEEPNPPVRAESTAGHGIPTSGYQGKEFKVSEANLPYVTSTQQMYQPNFELTTPQSSDKNQLNLLVDPKERNELSVKSDESASNSLYLGRLLPVHNETREQSDPQLTYVGDGVKLPVTLKRLRDGTFALTLSDSMYKLFANKRCTRCLPSNDNGPLVRERRRSSDIIPKLSFADDEALIAKAKLKMAGIKYMRRESEEYDENKMRKKMVLKNLEKSDKNINRSKEKKLGEKNEKYYENVSLKTLFNERDDNSLIAILKQLRNQQSEAAEGPPYRYQRYVHYDKNVEKRTNALKNMVYWMRNLLVNSPKK